MIEILPRICYATCIITHFTSISFIGLALLVVIPSGSQSLGKPPTKPSKAYIFDILQNMVHFKCLLLCLPFSLHLLLLFSVFSFVVADFIPIGTTTSNIHPAIKFSVYCPCVVTTVPTEESLSPGEAFRLHSYNTPF